MRIYILVCGILIIATGIAATTILPKPHSIGFLQGTLTLGGGILISGLFSLKMKWHGIIAGGVMALLGAARGLGNIPGLLDFLAGERTRGSAPLLELGVTAVCLVLLISVLRALQRERTRRMLEAD